MRKILFDARALEHPEPLERATRYLQEMDESSYLYMLHRKKPVPLLQLAANNGFSHLSHEAADGIWHIIITKTPHTNLKALLDV